VDIILPNKVNDQELFIELLIDGVNCAARFFAPAPVKGFAIFFLHWGGVYRFYSNKQELSENFQLHPRAFHLLYFCAM
jgi:hypothetical protein